MRPFVLSGLSVQSVCKGFEQTTLVSNILDPDEAFRFVGPVGPICLQMF